MTSTVLYYIAHINDWLFSHSTLQQIVEYVTLGYLCIAHIIWVTQQNWAKPWQVEYFPREKLLKNEGFRILI